MAFVALEGLPGSGKTTVREAVIKRLLYLGIPVHHVGQHGWLAPAASRAIIDARRGAIQLSSEPLIAALVEDKVLHYRENIAPFANGGVVLADRYSVSDLFLLSAIGGGGLEEYSCALDPKVLPMVTFILECSLEKAHSRLCMRPVRRFLDSSESISAASNVLSTAFPSRVSNRTMILINNADDDVEACAATIVHGLEQLFSGA